MSETIQQQTNQSKDEHLILHMIMQLNRLEEKIDGILQKSKASESESKLINGLVSEKEAIERFRKSQTWFWERRRDKLLPFTKLGKTILYKEEDLNNLLLNSGQ